MYCVTTVQKGIEDGEEGPQLELEYQVFQILILELSSLYSLGK